MSLEEFDATKAAYVALEPLDPESRARAVRHLAEALGVVVDARPTRNGATTSDEGNGVGSQDVGPGGTPPTPKGFLTMKQPSTQVEQVACLGYYLAHHQGTPHFNSANLSKLNLDAAGKKIANMSRTVDDADKAGYLVSAGQGKKQMSYAGELVVQALPDRNAVKQVLDEHKPARRRSPAKAKKATKKADG